MRYRMFYYTAVFSRKTEIFWENGKKPLLGPQGSFEGKEASGDENEFNHFYGKWGLNIFSFNNFFENNYLKKK